MSLREKFEALADTFMQQLLIQLLNIRHLVIGDDFRIAKGRHADIDHPGRELGITTANVNLRRRQGAVMGIFAVRDSGLGNPSLGAVARVATRPTSGGTKPILEVHIFDFDEDIYGKYIHVDFVARLRSELKFDEVRNRVEQLQRDAESARVILAA